MTWVQHKCVLPCLFCVFLVILVRRITITVKSVVFCLFRGFNQPALLLLENQENCYCLLVFLLYLTTSYKRKPISRHTVDTVFENYRKTLIHYCELNLAVKQYLLPDRSVFIFLNWWKMPKFKKKFKCDILFDFQTM